MIESAVHLVDHVLPEQPNSAVGARVRVSTALPVRRPTPGTDSAFENDVAKTNCATILEQPGFENIRSL